MWAKPKITPCSLVFMNTEENYAWIALFYKLAHCRRAHQQAVENAELQIIASLDPKPVQLPLNADHQMAARASYMQHSGQFYDWMKKHWDLGMLNDDYTQQMIVLQAEVKTFLDAVDAAHHDPKAEPMAGKMLRRLVGAYRPEAITATNALYEALRDFVAQPLAAIADKELVRITVLGAEIEAYQHERTAIASHVAVDSPQEVEKMVRNSDRRKHAIQQQFDESEQAFMASYAVLDTVMLRHQQLDHIANPPGPWMR